MFRRRSCRVQTGSMVRAPKIGKCRTARTPQYRTNREYHSCSSPPDYAAGLTPSVSAKLPRMRRLGHKYSLDYRECQRFDEIWRRLHRRKRFCEPCLPGSAKEPPAGPTIQARRLTRPLTAARRVKRRG
jgi:hypothetical protein